MMKQKQRVAWLSRLLVFSHRCELMRFVGLCGEFDALNSKHEFFLCTFVKYLKL